MHFTCTHCNAVFTHLDAFTNYTRATDHARRTGHGVVDQNRYALQADAALHGIK